MSQDHLGGAYPQGDSNTYMVDVFGYLLVKYELKSVLDIGAGYGHTLKWFSDNGLCQIKGIEGMAEYVEKSLVKDAMVLHDFTTGPAPVAQPFDLAWSAEFVEHVDKMYIPNFMKAFELARVAVITHGEPGQAGQHHVNCQPSSFWVDVFQKWGFVWDEQESLLLRRTDRWRAVWGRRSLLSFKRK